VRIEGNSKLTERLMREQLAPYITISYHHTKHDLPKVLQAARQQRKDYKIRFKKKSINCRSKPTNQQAGNFATHIESFCHRSLPLTHTPHSFHLSPSLLIVNHHGYPDPSYFEE
jgi:hypothetical protein